MPIDVYKLLLIHRIGLPEQGLNDKVFEVHFILSSTRRTEDHPVVRWKLQNLSEKMKIIIILMMMKQMVVLAVKPLYHFLDNLISYNLVKEEDKKKR